MQLNSFEDQKDLLLSLEGIEGQIALLSDRKIKVFFEFLGLHQRDDMPQDYLHWEEILLVVPHRHLSNSIKKYRYSISRISFLTNPNAEQIHIFDARQYRNASKNKTRFQIRHMLRDSFGGVRPPMDSDL